MLHFDQRAGSRGIRISCWICLLATLACAGVVLLGRHAIPAEPPGIEEVAIEEEDRQHWAFQPLRRPGLPELAAADREDCQGPLDLFIRSAMLSRGLKRSPPADRQTLIRRLTLDLTGLPPSPREVDKFVADPGQTHTSPLLTGSLPRSTWASGWLSHGLIFLDLPTRMDLNTTISVPMHGSTVTG